MSSGTRTTSKGGKGAKTDKSHKTDKGDVGKGSGDKQQRDTSIKSEDVSMQDKVKLLIDLSQKTEDEVCLALHDCDNDIQQAINMLLEDQGTGGEWCVKKKKNRQASTSKGEKGEDGAADDWNDAAPVVAGDKENNNSNYKSRGGGRDGGRDGKRGGGPPRLHDRHNDNRGWRGRENGGDDWNSSGGRGGGERRGGRGGGAPRGGGGGRGRGGGRGGRYGPRGGSGRSDRGGGGGGSFNKPFDTWDNSNTWDNNTVANTNHNTEENWDDFPGTDEWTTEEYTGSLADTKVFTPSTQQDDEPNDQQQMQPPAGTVPPGQDQFEQPSGGIMSQSPVPIVGTLNAAQTQYLSQLTQQNSESMNKQYATGGGTLTYQQQQPQTQQTQTQQGAALSQQQQQTYAGSAQTAQYANAASYNSAYPATAAVSYDASAQQQTQQPPVRTKTQRARVPPPSKIPSSAVEMPGEMNSFQYLDVQFGAMDFTDGGGGLTFDASSVDAPKYSTTSNNLEATTGSNAQDSSADNTYPSSVAAKNQTQSSISSALSQSLSSTDNIPQTSEHLTTSSYSAASRGGANAAAQSQQAQSGGSNGGGGGMDQQMSQKGASDANTYSQQSTYNSYQSKANTYNSSNYSGAQTTTSSYVSGQSNNYVNSQSAATAGAGNAYQPSTGAGGNTAANSYSNAYSSGGGNSAGGYQGGNANNAFPTISQANSYPTNNQNYPQNTSQSVYGANTGLSNSSGYGQASSASQYNNYGSSASAGNKLKENNSYDGTGSSANAAANSGSSQSAANNVTSSSAALSSLTQTTVAASSKSTTTLAAKNSNSVVSNIPPGVAPVMSTPYIMGQVPYFAQQPVYSYEDMQLLQQRIPHMTTPYYDMSYQTPTTLAAVRDASAMGNVGYSMSSDGRFARGGDNASPVPSTLSQQQTSTLTQGHQAQPILAGGAPPYFFAATAFNTIAPNYQFGTMYTQLPAATNAHGTNSSSQYPKPGTGYSGYGAYDPLGQTQDYSKGSYVGSAAAAAQAQKGGAGGGNASTTGSAGNDLSAMYGKSHTALGKVNGFHSGTPPPFTGTLHGSQSAGLAPSGTGYGPQVYIPTMAPHQQHHSTPLMHQPHMQDSGNSSGQRSQGSNQAKAGSKQSYPNSYWNQS